MPDKIEKIVPTCRYGHGNLEKIALMAHDNEPRGLFIPTYRQIPNFGSAMVDGRGFSVVGYRCAVCGYLELFDDEVSNGG